MLFLSHCRNFLLSAWSSQSKENHYQDLLNLLNQQTSRIAYETWMSVCHPSLCKHPHWDKAYEVHEVFTEFTHDICQSVQTIVPPEELLEAIKNDHGIPLHEGLSVSDILKGVMEKSSFFNDHFIMNLSERYGTEKDKEKRSFYELIFTSLQQLHIDSLPSNVYGNYILKLNKDYVEIVISIQHGHSLNKVKKICLLCSTFSDVFDVPQSFLHILFVERNILHGLVHKKFAEQLLNIPSEQYDLLVDVYVQKYRVLSNDITVSVK